MEIASIPYEKNFMDSYIVPYHVHNDYLETAAETGIIGALFYYGFLFSIFILLIKKVFFESNAQIDRVLLFIFFVAFCTYFIDALFNFPFARMLSQINIIYLSALLINTFDYKIRKPNKSINILVVLILLIFPLSLYSSVRIYNQSQHFRVLHKQFNLNEFTKPSLEVIDKYDMDFLTVNATTLPLYALKGIWYAEQTRYREAIEFFRKGIKHNPNLYIGESFMGYAYYKINELDSALKYTEIGFYNLPNNLVHYANYLQVLTVLKDSASVKKAYSSVPIKQDAHDELYLLSMSDIVSPGSNENVFKDFDINLSTGNNQLKKGYYSVLIGADKMYEADYFYLLGVRQFENKEFDNALTNFKKAVDINPYELPYKENVANTLMQLGQDEEALIILNELIDEDKTDSANAFYLRALILYGMGERESACSDLNYLKSEGQLGNNTLYSTLCNLEAIRD